MIELDILNFEERQEAWVRTILNSKIVLNWLLEGHICDVCSNEMGRDVCWITKLDIQVSGVRCEVVVHDTLE